MKKDYQSLSLDETQKHLDSVSKSFCGAKWNQVLFQFHLGSLHNCCLTLAQPIDLKNIFESKQLVEERQGMLDGKKINQCGVCWKAEEKGFASDRVYKSSESWSQKLYEPGVKPTATQVIPAYIELSLSNRCQFKCAYCSPENSSSLFKESKEFGPYRLSHDFNSSHYLERGKTYFLENDENPYVNAFIEWYPKVAHEVKVLRFTGGEPILSDRIFDILNLLKKYSSPELELIFNSNLGVLPKVLDQFLEDLKQLPEGSYRKLSFVTSIDGWGFGAKLARWGLDLELFERNYLRVREVFPNAEIRFTCTANLLAISHMKPLLEKILEWKKTQVYDDQVLITAYPLHYPAFLSLNWSHSFFKKEIDEAMEFLNQNYDGKGGGLGFKEVERDMLEKALNFQPSNELNKMQLIDFTLFLLQHQHRKKWNRDDLSPSLKALLQKGITVIETDLTFGDMDPLMAVKCIPWVRNSQKKMQKLLAQPTISGQVNPWQILEIQLSYVEFLDPSWIAWWMRVNPEAGIKLAGHESLLNQIDFNAVVLSSAPGADPTFWSALTENPTLFDLLKRETVDELFRIFPKENLTTYHRFFMETVEAKFSHIRFNWIKK